MGSRDEKVCQSHCSKVCCVTGVKQAMEMKELFPEADVFNFYMDIRMFGPGYEEMYRRAQQDYNIHFVRGRISEASPTIEGRIQIKAEDTLTGRPLKMSVDMLVLLVGMRANDDNGRLAARTGLRQAPSGFMEPRDRFLGSAGSGVEGIFYAGAVTAPKNLGESLCDGAAAALAVRDYLNTVSYTHLYVVRLQNFLPVRMSISVTRGSFRAGGRTPGREARHAQLPEGLGAEAGFFEQMVPEQEPADVGRDPGFGKVGQAQTVAAPAVNRDRIIGGCVASLGRAIGGFEEACEPLEKGRDQLQNPLRLFAVRDQQVVIDNRLDQLGDQCDARLLDYVARIVEGCLLYTSTGASATVRPAP